MVIQQWWACFSTGDDENWHTLNAAPFRTYNEARQLLDSYAKYQPGRQYAIGSEVGGIRALTVVDYGKVERMAEPTFALCKCGHFEASHTRDGSKLYPCRETSPVYTTVATPVPNVSRRELLASGGPCKCTVYVGMTC